MGMQVHIDEELSLLLLLDDSFLRCEDGGLVLYSRLRVVSVQILVQSVQPIVAPVDSIWVEHGDYLENKVFSEDPGLFTFFVDQKVDDSIQDKGRWGLPWVDPRGQKDRLLVELEGPTFLPYLL